MNYLVNVRRGMELLDRVMPDWLWRVDVEVLNLHNCYKCVIGQLTGIDDAIYSDALTRYGETLYTFGVDPGCIGQAAYGFNIGGHSDWSGERWRQLTAAWKTAILAERARRQVAVPNETLEVARDGLLVVAN